MKRTITTFFLVLFLSACTPVATSALTQTPAVIETLTSAPSATFTSIPPTPTIAPTPITSPTVEVKLADLPQTKAAVDQFATAMKSAGFQADADQIRQGLTTKEIAGKDGKKCEIALTQDGYPLMAKTEGSKWEKATPKNISNCIKFNLSINLGGYGSVPDYNNLVRLQKQDFNSGVVFFGAWMQNSDGSFNFSAPQNDAMIGQDAKMNAVMGANLIWPNDTPEWIKNGQYSKNQMEDIIRKYLQATVGEFKGKINSWVLVNEYGHPSLVLDKYFQTMGEGYVDFAFQEARRLDPTAILIYNDFYNETKGRSRYKLTKQIIDRLKTEDAKVGVGLEMHLKWRDSLNPDEVIAAMQSYGVPVYITEFDVNMAGFNGSQAEKEQFQANIYRKMIAAAVRSGVCAQFNIFGLIDRLSVFVSPGRFGGIKDASPLIFHDDFSPKQSYYGVLAGLVDGLGK
jgi:GH35 family endo-1,4-beta-xylanase